MTHALPIDTKGQKRTVQSVTPSGLNSSKTTSVGGMETVMNLDTSTLPDLVGHGRFQSMQLSDSGIVLQLYYFTVKNSLYLVGFDGNYVVLYGVTDAGYQKLHAFSDTVTQEQLQTEKISAVYCHSQYGEVNSRCIVIYPFGYCIKINRYDGIDSFEKLEGNVSELHLRHAVLHKNRIFATDGHRIYASRPGSLTDFTSHDEDDESASWSAVISDDVNAALPVTGFIRYRGKLYYFCQNSFGQIRGETNPFRTEALWEVGAVDIESVKVLGDQLYFLSEKGLIVFDGQTVNSVSEPLGIGSFAAGVGGVWKGQYYLGLPGDTLGKIYTYCPQNKSWGSILCYGNAVQFCTTNDRFYQVSDFSGQVNLYKWTDQRNGWTATTNPITVNQLEEKHLLGVRMEMLLQNGARVNCDLTVTRRDGSTQTYPLFQDITGKTRMIVSKRLRDIYGIAFSFSFRATLGAAVSKWELVWEENEVTV